jgi:hypothetical protein
LRQRPDGRDAVAAGRIGNAGAGGDTSADALFVGDFG